jgi:hypothetical protein
MRQALKQTGGYFIRTQPRGMIEYLRRQHEFVGSGAIDERSEAPTDRVGRSDGGRGQHVGEHGFGCRRKLSVVSLQGRRELRGASAAQIDERLLHGRGEEPRLRFGVSRKDVESQHQIGMRELL